MAKHLHMRLTPGLQILQCVSIGCVCNNKTLACARVKLVDWNKAGQTLQKSGRYAVFQVPFLGSFSCLNEYNRPFSCTEMIWVGKLLFLPFAAACVTVKALCLFCSNVCGSYSSSCVPESRPCHFCLWKMDWIVLASSLARARGTWSMLYFRKEEKHNEFI